MASAAKRTAQLREGVSIQLTPEQHEKVKDYIIRSRYIAMAVQEVGRAVAQIEAEMWAYLHGQYPGLENFDSGFNSRDGIIEVQERRDSPFKIEDILPAPFQRQQYEDSASKIGAAIKDVLIEVFGKSALED